MIITRIPFRLPLGGGGTDLPSYYKLFGGQLITASINKYIYISINEPAISDKIKLHYLESETINSVSEIKHNIIRECLKFKNINRPIEISSNADIGRGTGMGSSSAFTVGLLAGLNTLERKFVSPRMLAEEACKLEIEILGNPIGKQDQYAVALGGINELIIDHEGVVTVNPVRLDEETVFELEDRLLMFYTNVTRDANEILAEQGKSIDEDKAVEAMHEIKIIGKLVKQCLIDSDIDRLGELLHQHWEVKKTISKKMSSDDIDEYYRVALDNGAIGGKIMGAGGGGVLLLCCRDGERRRLKESLEKIGLKQMYFRFEFDGVKVLTNI